MNLKLVRNSFGLYGVFGTLFDEFANFSVVTLEHAYRQPDNTWRPKVPAGVYVCKRGMHRLETNPVLFEAFEVTNVPGHTNILLHRGNYNNDSAGCILVGMRGDHYCILDSREAFEGLMKLQAGLDNFQLTIVDSGATS
jgi:hypothetical protein